MTWTEGRRVRLVADLRLAGTVTRAEAEDTGAEETEPGARVGSLLLAEGTEGTVVRVETVERTPDEDVREYERLSSLFTSFGDQMPPASRQRLVDRLASLEPAWTAYQERTAEVRLRVRLDNGLVLADARPDVFV